MCVAGSVRCGYHNLTINILQGQSPRFLNTPYEKELTLSQAVNSTIFTVSAVDDDLQGNLFKHSLELSSPGLVGELVYRAVGEYPAQQFFAIRQDGSVVVRRSLRDDLLRNTQYKVNRVQSPLYSSHSCLLQLMIEAYDSAVPGQRANTTLFITVRNNAPTVSPSSATGLCHVTVMSCALYITYLLPFS